MPFVIEWRHGMPTGPADGPVLADVTVQVPDPDRLARLLTTLGMSEVTGAPPGPRRWFRDDVAGSANDDRDEVVRVVLEAGEPAAAIRASFTLAVSVDVHEVKLDGIGIWRSRDLRIQRAHPVLATVDEIFADRDPDLVTYREWLGGCRTLARRPDPDPARSRGVARSTLALSIHPR